MRWAALHDSMLALMLAPMEGYTDAAFRTLCHTHGAELTFTEMAHVDSLVRGNNSSLMRIATPDDTPVQIQLLTGREDELARFLSRFRPSPGFRGFNLNLSCPSPEVIRHGKGAAMIKRASKTDRLVSLIRDHGYQVSVKLRLGTNTHEKALKVYLNCLRGVDADFFVVHAKTASQDSAEPADFAVYPECVDAAGGRLVIANGDVDTPEKVRELERTGVAGVMIGRAALTNPAIFDEVKNRLGLDDPPKPIPGPGELRLEYSLLSASLRGSERCRENALRFIGAEPGSKPVET